MPARVTEPAEPTDRAAERALLARWQAGDAAAFPLLLRPHLGALLALGKRLCRDPHWAEDLVQETLVRAHRGLPDFRGDCALRSWLFRILVRLAAEPQRWQPGHGAPTGVEFDVPDHVGADVAEAAIARELQSRLDEAMERLTPRQRTALHLRAAEGLDYAAIGEVLGCSAVAVRMQVMEARRKVMARLQEHLDP
jgi:RNA polymerase sigma-70 factor (ECF subfamily)